LAASHRAAAPNTNAPSRWSLTDAGLRFAPAKNTDPDMGENASK